MIKEIQANIVNKKENYQLIIKFNKVCKDLHLERIVMTIILRFNVILMIIVKSIEIMNT